MEICGIKNNFQNYKGNRQLRKIKREIKPLMDSCHYSKRNLIENPQDISFQLVDGKIYIKGFYTSYNKEDELDGICEELSYKTGKILEEKYKGKYIPVCISTIDYEHNFDKHCCLFLFKDNKHTRYIKEQLNKASTYVKKANQTKDDLKTSPFDELKIHTYHALKERIKEIADNIEAKIKEHDFLNDGIFVDPSFGVIEKYKKIKDYEFLYHFCTIEQNNPYKNGGALKKLSGYLVPLGFIEDIFPQLFKKEDYPKDTLVMFFLDGDNKDKISLIVDEYKHRKYDVYNLEYLKKYYKDSDVTNFLDVVNKKLNSEGFLSNVKVY